MEDESHKIKKTSMVPCPKCKRTNRFDEENPYRPFCSKRCKNIDLADWATEEYRISKPLNYEESEQEESDPQSLDHYDGIKKD